MTKISRFVCKVVRCMSERGDGCKVLYKWNILIVTKKQKFNQQFLTGERQDMRSRKSEFRRYKSWKIKNERVLCNERKISQKCSFRGTIFMYSNSYNPL